MKHEYRWSIGLLLLGIIYFGWIWMQKPSMTDQTLPLKEISNDSQKNECLLIINQNIYNVTPFIQLHPGGAEVIINMCGKDATEAFNTQGGKGKHSAKAVEMLLKYLVKPVGVINE